MGIGIPDGGIAVIDRDMKPNVFDVVWCMNPMATLSGYLKQIVQTGEKAIVHTCYIDKSKNYQFYAPEILGVVLKVLDYDRNVVWERPEPVEYAPVVRCRTCKFAGQDDPFDPIVCGKWSGKFTAAFVEPNDFCSYGERKDDTNIGSESV